MRRMSTTPPPAGSTESTRVRAFVEHLERSRALPPHLQVPAAPNEPGLLREALERLRLEHEELAIASGEHALAVERVQYREVFDSAPDPMFITDPSAVVQEANLAALQLLSMEAHSLRGKPMVVLVGRNDAAAFIDALGRVERERAVELDVDVEGRRGARARVRLRGVLLRGGRRVLWSAREVEPTSEPADKGESEVDALGRALYAQAESLRRLQRQNAEVAAREQEAHAALAAAESALDAKDRAMAVLSHELRGPLNIILGWARLLQTDDRGEAERMTALRSVERQALAQSALVDDMLDAASLAAGHTRLRFEVLDLGALVEVVVEGVRPVAEGRSLELACAATTGAIVLGDRGRLTQVVTNLLSNAFKFTPRGGRVDVRCTAGATPDARTVELVLEDTGRGMHDSELEAVFGFFQQGRDGLKQGRSLGLGLYLVRQYVELHGGTVRAESMGAGQGARFVVSLPALSLALPTP